MMLGSKESVTVIKHMKNHKYGGEPIEKLNPENGEMIAAFSFEVWSYSVRTSRGTATAFNSRSAIRYNSLPFLIKSYHEGGCVMDAAEKVV